MCWFSHADDQWRMLGKVGERQNGTGVRQGMGGLDGGDGGGAREGVEPGSGTLAGPRPGPVSPDSS